MKNKVKKLLQSNNIEFIDKEYSVVKTIFLNETKDFIGLTPEFKTIWIANKMSKVKCLK